MWYIVTPVTGVVLYIRPSDHMEGFRWSSEIRASKLRRSTSPYVTWGLGVVDRTLDVWPAIFSFRHPTSHTPKRSFSLLTLVLPFCVLCLSKLDLQTREFPPERARESSHELKERGACRFLERLLTHRKTGGAIWKRAPPTRRAPYDCHRLENWDQVFAIQLV